MKCHIVQNGGYMFFILCFSMFICSFEQEHVYTIQEFCSGNLYIHNIESGEPYKLTLKSEVSSTVNKWHQKNKRKCWQEFKTSDSGAHFVVSIHNMSIPSCSNICRCNYFEIVSGHSKRYCGESENSVPKVFYSKSDKISIEFHPGSSQKFDVTLVFTVERNTYIIEGSSESSTYIETPYFPVPYPPTYRAEYILQSSDLDGQVLLLFLDFQISSQSFVEVYGTNGTHPTRFYGNIFRPPVVISQASRLTLKFFSNDDQAVRPGFRAFVSFIKTNDSLVVPYTDCSGSKDGRGGHMNVKTHVTFSLYDCVWHIQPLSPFAISNRSVSVQLEKIGHKSNLEFRSGDNSKAKIVKEFNCENKSCENLNIETVVPASEYLYIRFNGYLDVESVINISYSTYHMGKCSNKEFRCEEDGRCLLTDFRCDGIKQCPDGMDEVLCPSPNVTDPVPLQPTIHTESFHTNDTNFIIVVFFGCCGLSSLCIIIFISVHNYCRRRNVAAPPILPQQSVAEMSVPSILFTESVCDTDSPPSYEDFIKSSECYPPLQYTRPKQYFIPKDSRSHCTTSFCTATRVRHYSADSCSARSSNADNSSDMFLDNAGCMPSQSSSSCDVEIFQNNLAFKKSDNMKRAYSLDSKLNELVNQDSCHLFLSIHRTRDCSNQKAIRSPDSNIDVSKDRRFTWSFIPRRPMQSEIITVVKTRCFSDPYNGFSVQCSLH